MRFWDSLEVGAEEELGRHLFTAEDIVRFARKYDPQIFHLDAEAAKATMFGGLCASGWHTSAEMMRLIVESQTRRVGAWMKAGNPMPKLGPSPGAKALKWTRPIFAGDTVVYRQTLTAKRASQSRPGWGIVETKVEASNQDEEIVFSMQGAVLIGTD